ncbi:outer membrane protein assembly factor BamB family protein [Brachybacterium hainanense]|uniref:PQQ-binding-like beta-propeller repeat protein n=1 Tax=Brachybacterium hainanense TaxID=1541174 RepID=A0ABV6RBS5_9MICO
MTKHLRLAAATSLMALVLSSCSVVASVFTPDPRDDLPLLEVAWTVEGEVPLIALDGAGTPENTSVTSGDRYFATYHGDGMTTGVQAVDLTSGTTLWKTGTNLLCGLSEPSPSGVLVAWQSGEGESMTCDTASALSADTGETLWTQRIDAPMHRGGLGPMSVGATDSTVTVPTACGILRLDAATGEALGHLPDSPCGDELDPGTSAITTGELIIVPGADSLAAFDADTGDEVWRTPGAAVDIEGVRSRDPLVLDMTVDGVAGIREVDVATGEIGAVIGRPLSAIHAGDFPIALTSGDEIVGSYENLIGGTGGTYGSSVRAWERASGEETFVWHAAGDELIGVDETGTYVGRTIDTDSSGGYAYWVMHRAPGGELESAGWIDDQVLEFAKVGDLLLVHGWADPGDDSDLQGAITTAYRLPTQGTDVEPPEPKGAPEPIAWADGDVRSDPTVDLCAQVEPSTLRELGIGEAADRPAPLGCAWEGGGVYLSAAATAYAPGTTDPVTGQEGELRSGAEQAQSALDGVRAAGGYSDVAGLGDEAIALTSETVGAPAHGELYAPPVSSAGVELVVREGNLLVAISVGSGETPTIFTPAPESALPISGARLEQIAIQAAGDVIVAADADPLDAPAVEDPIGVPDVCGTVTVEGIDDSPDPLASGTDPRASACLWQGDDQAAVGGYVYAAAYEAGPGPLSGITAADRAAAVYGASQGEPLEIDGADEAHLVRSPGSWDGAVRVVARSGDVVVIAQVSTHPEEASPEAASRALEQSTAEATRIVEELLAAR